LFAIIDIETTGGRSQSDRITEVAIFVHDGQRMVGEFQSLVNPEQTIPYFITGLTGITNQMVEDAPHFFEIARNIVEITENCTFVAHNAKFDYSFIREEFKRLGYTYKREILDTIKLSRKLIPGLKSYSLDKLCSEVGIQIKDRHRAAGDALATVKLFELLLQLDQNKNHPLFSGPALKKLYPGLDINVIRKLPEEAGVYYFYDKNGDFLYIGKSKNIYQRVHTHLANNTTRRAIEMRDRIADISFEITGSELIACLLESDEIKKNKPVYNRAQRRSSAIAGIYSFTDDKEYLHFEVAKKSNGTLLSSFNSVGQAREYLTQLTDEYHLCQKLTGLYESPGPCFQYQIGICLGACVGEELPETYNKRAEKVLETFRFKHQNFLIIDSGRNVNEKSVVKVEKGKYLGFGYFDSSEGHHLQETMHDCIRSYMDNRDVQSIIKRYLRSGKIEQVILFNEDDKDLI